MTNEQYDIEKARIEEEHQKALIKLAQDYALANSTVKIDDIVTDHIGSVQVKKIVVSVYNKPYPCCTYRGIELKKDGTPMKKQEGRGVWQPNIIK